MNPTNDTSSVISRLGQFFRGYTHFFTPIRLVIMLSFLLFSWFILFGDMGLLKYQSLTSTRAHFQNRISETKSELERLKTEEEKLKDPHYLETIIRQELGYIKEDEVIFKIESQPSP